MGETENRIEEKKMKKIEDISQIEFRTTQKKRIQMTYVFKRLTDAKEGEDYEIT